MRDYGTKVLEHTSVDLGDAAGIRDLASIIEHFDCTGGGDYPEAFHSAAHLVSTLRKPSMPAMCIFVSDSHPHCIGRACGCRQCGSQKYSEERQLRGTGFDCFSVFDRMPDSYCIAVLVRNSIPEISLRQWTTSMVHDALCIDCPTKLAGILKGFAGSVFVNRDDVSLVSEQPVDYQLQAASVEGGVATTSFRSLLTKFRGEFNEKIAKRIVSRSVAVSEERLAALCREVGMPVPTAAVDPRLFIDCIVDKLGDAVVWVVLEEERMLSPNLWTLLPMKELEIVECLPRGMFCSTTEFSAFPIPLMTMTASSLEIIFGLTIFQSFEVPPHCLRSTLTRAVASGVLQRLDERAHDRCIEVLRCFPILPAGVLLNEPHKLTQMESLYFWLVQCEQKKRRLCLVYLL